ncbi:hypothetical protein C8R44DRAFT_989825 [Mycena epipterygia]|nr:hypothetical protein C8R44DRAFT_989825 [Mycena epipterygia]
MLGGDRRKRGSLDAGVVGPLVKSALAWAGLWKSDSRGSGRSRYGLGGGGGGGLDTGGDGDYDRLEQRPPGGEALLTSSMHDRPRSITSRVTDANDSKRTATLTIVPACRPPLPEAHMLNLSGFRPAPTSFIRRQMPVLKLPPSLSKLEFSFGLRWKQLHIDTTSNLVYKLIYTALSITEDGSCSRKRTSLKGSKSTCKAQEPRLINRFAPVLSPFAISTSSQVFTDTKFTYRIIPLQLFKDETTVFQRISKGEYSKILPVEPPSPPTVESHANPFFVIANAGAKLEEHLALLPSDWRSSPDILAVLGLWTEWKTVVTTEQWAKSSP